MNNSIKSKLNKIELLKQEICKTIKEDITSVNTFPPNAKILSTSPLVFTMPSKDVFDCNSLSPETISGENQKKYIVDKIHNINSVEGLISFIEKIIKTKRINGNIINPVLLKKLEEIYSQCK